MSALAAPLFLVGTGLQVAGMWQQGNVAEANAKAEAANLEANAAARRAEAAEKARYYGQQALQARREGVAQESRALAGYGAAGVAPNAVVLSQINKDTADQIYEFQRAGAMAYRTGQWEADRMNQQARYTRKIGKLQKRSYQLSSIGTGIGGLYRFGSGSVLTS